ncbi:hypothetical protein FQZ97_818750 [compost metagenome]
MAKKTIDGPTAARGRQEKLAAARLAEREQVLVEMPEYQRVAQALHELGNSAQHPGVRREVLALGDSVRSVFDRLERKAEMLAGPSVAELLLPLGVQHRLREADFMTLQHVREALVDGGSRLVRLPAIGVNTCNLIRAHLEAFDAGEPPPPKTDRSKKVVSLTKRERVLAEKMGLSAEQAGELLKSAR